MQCYAGLEDTTFIHIKKAVPLNSSETSGFKLNRAELRAGGVPVELSKDSETLYWSTSPIVPFSIGAIGGALSDMISSAMGGGTMDINIGDNKHISVLLFNSNDLTDGSICFNSDCSIYGDYPGEGDGKAVVVEYRLNIYSFSKECYYYFQALNNQDRNFLAQLGLSPPNYSYSNVAGGYGVVAGLNLTSGEWVRYADISSK